VNACGGYAGSTGALVAATGDAPAVGGYQLPVRCFVLTDEVTGQLYALRASGVDLSALVGQRVTVLGFENGKVEGGLPLLDVIRVRLL
jgi:hypothetical protein